jgi:hypothetical protein
MTPSPELAAFLHGETDPRGFRHADHVRLAHEALGLHPFLDAARAYAAALKAMTVRAGKPEIYHETITVAFLALIAERRAAASDADYGAFAAANPDLFDKQVLARWYGDKLALPAARRTFVLPEPIR